MNIGRKKRFALVAVIAVFAVAEEVCPINVSYSLLSSTTSTEDRKIPGPTAHPVANRIERPFTRCFPLIKWGETLYGHTYEFGDNARSMFERTVTTRTRLFVIGFCSVAKYDARADEPDEAFRRKNLGDDRLAPKAQASSPAMR